MTKDLVKVFDMAGKEHRMTYPNARDLVSHDGWTWKPNNPSARPPKVKPDPGPALGASDDPPEDAEAADAADEDATAIAEAAASVPDTAGLAHGVWSGLTRTQAVEKAQELGLAVDKRWNRQRIIDEITAATSN